jgi:flagellar motor protein MotB
MKKLFALLIFSIISACGGMKNSCVDANKIEKKSAGYLISKADSISAIKKSEWEQKAELEKQGIISDINFESNIYFDQNCFTTEKLEFAYFAIGAMLKDKNLKIRIIGNLDKFELQNNPELSLKRAKFVQTIMIKNGIEKSRIEILDVKNDRPKAPLKEKGREENRRTDFEIING